MLGLTLRPEFQGKRLSGTTIDLEKMKQVPAAEFLQITYPTVDVLSALESLAPDNNRPLVLIGEREQGKSHLMSALYHAAVNPDVVRNWLQEWAPRLERTGQVGYSRRQENLYASL
jgi:DNA replication protein DnaC